MSTAALESLNPSRRDTVLAFALLVLGALAVAFMPATAKIAFQQGANTETVVTIRAQTGALLLCLYLLIRKGLFTIPRPLVGAIVIASIASALMNYTYYSSVHYIPIGLATLIIFTNPLWVAFYYHKTGEAVLTRSRLLWGVAALAGLALALAVDFTGVSVQGLCLAGASAVFATIMVLTMVRVSKEVGGVTTNFHLSLWTLVLFVFILASFGSVQWPSSTLGWASSVGNGLAYIVAYVSFLMAAGLIGASRATMLTFMEPLAAILLAALLFGEQLSAVQWTGVILVAAGLFAMEAPKDILSRRRKTTAH